MSNAASDGFRMDSQAAAVGDIMTDNFPPAQGDLTKTQMSNSQECRINAV